MGFSYYHFKAKLLVNVWHKRRFCLSNEIRDPNSNCWWNTLCLDFVLRGASESSAVVYEFGSPKRMLLAYPWICGLVLSFRWFVGLKTWCFHTTECISRLCIYIGAFALINLDLKYLLHYTVNCMSMMRILKISSQKTTKSGNR